MIDLQDELWRIEKSQWESEVGNAIENADIAILLLSANFLASGFINDIEFPRLRLRKRAGLALIPVLVRPCAWQEVRWLANLQILPRDGTPLEYSRRPDKTLAQLAQQIIEASEILQARQAPEEAGDVLQEASAEEASRGESSRTPRVFVSHQGEDGDFAEVLKLRLEKAGFEAWVDVDRLRVGDDWRLEVDDAIRSAAALVVVMSPKAKESEYVTYEWAFAWGAGTKVIPLLLRHTQLHPRLEALQYLDFSNRRARPWARLLEELRAAVTVMEQ